METNSSISFIMSNLLIGLCKGSRTLGNYSEIFHNQLGYNFFRLDLSFPISIRRTINPDAIITSQKTENTILFEWTELEDAGPKIDQFTRYASVSSSDLANFAAIPPKEAKIVDICLVLRPDAVQSFNNQLIQNNQNFPILSLDVQNQLYLLLKVANFFQVKETDTFFSTGISVNSIPRYLPFSIEKISLQEIVPFVVQHFTSLLIKGEKDISLPDFCKGFISVWNLIGLEKQKALSNMTKSLLNDMLRKKWGYGLAKRNGDNPPSWLLSPLVFRKNPKSYRKLLNDFIAEVRKDTYQIGFDF